MGIIIRIRAELAEVVSYLRTLSPAWAVIYLVLIYCLWLYLLKFFTLSVDYVVEVSRSIMLGGLQMNTSYYPVETTIKYLGGVILACFVLIQNEVGNLLRKPREWRGYIVTLLGVGVYIAVLLLVNSLDLSPRSQFPFLVIGGAVLTGILLFLNQLKPLLLLLTDSVRNPAGVVALWRESWYSVFATLLLVGGFLFILFNLPFLPVLAQDLARFLSLSVLVSIIFIFLLLAREDAKPALMAHRTAAMVFLVVLPALLFAVLRIMILVKTDPRWEITLEFMDDVGGFPINNWPNQVTPTEDSRWLFYQAAIINSARATLASIFLCTVIGVVIGVTRLSSNRLAATLATAYVEVFRNVPLAVLLFIVITQMDQSLPLFRDQVNYWEMLYISNQGIWTPAIEPVRFLLALLLLAGVKGYTLYADREGVDDSDTAVKRRLALWGVALLIGIALILTGEINNPNYIKPNLSAPGSWRIEDGTGFEISTAFIALVTGLTLYTSTFVAEIVRGSIQSLPRGQIEAAISLGLTPLQRLRLVIMPQALRSMIPLLNNQYMNVWKNSSLAIVVAFSDIFYITLVMMNNVGKLIPLFTLLLVTYQVGSLIISGLMNAYNSRVTRVKI